MKKKIVQEINLISLVERFRSEDKCRDYLEDLRWPHGVVCPRCGSLSISKIIERNQFDCNSCRYQFSVTVNTIFQDSHMPLWKWLATVYLMIESKKGISANQISRTIKVSYKTAWYLCHRIRSAMAELDAKDLMGIIEVDETYIGGVKHGEGKGNKTNKAIVDGAIQRGGDARLDTIEHLDRKTLHDFIYNHVSPNATAIYTDERTSYVGLKGDKVSHHTVNHSAGEWTRGDVHTNSVENVWSLLKRSVVGSYHKVSIKHLDAYLNELEWRFNNRENPYLFRDTILKLINAENLEYKELIATSRLQIKQ